MTTTLEEIEEQSSSYNLKKDYFQLSDSPKNIGSIFINENLSFEEQEKQIVENLMSNENFYNNVKLEGYYYLLTDDDKIFGVCGIHKGFLFFDCAEHDDRVIIKKAFPHIKCYIIGEENE